ncbi:hypothetical protein FA95DRAFT_1613160 [Auriscalpium vulgare]|uniref:Uncharacterized protein n=1 Tax=Auriscalpium vulgare TaxID=40419 RepID=A0ACB8R4B6_9AGAM|nr:hypothetical protein FA95DRAFT_1613160 [Auriscalpium vulgare]
MANHYKRFKATSNHVREYSVSLLSEGKQPAVLGKRKSMHQLGITALIRQALVEAGIEAGNFPRELEDYLHTQQDSPALDDTFEEWTDDEDEDGAETQGLSAAEIAMHRTRLHAIVSIYGGKMRGKDRRTRMERRKAADDAWSRIAPQLLDVYLRWKYGTPEEQTESTASQAFSVQVIGLSNYSESANIEQAPQEEPNVALVRHGLLGATPSTPTLAFSLELLEFYRQLRRRQPSYGIQSFAKTVCAFHGLLYYLKLQEKLSRVFDVYLDLRSRLQSLTDEALSRNAPNWRALYGCPCCGFKQPNEPALVPARLHAMDGNSSQKRLRGAGRADLRQFHSDYFLSPAQVDVFANEVAGKRRKVPEPGPPVPDDLEGLPTANQPKSKCTDGWQAANATSMGKSVTEVFDQTGVFLTTCRHGIVELMTEMLRSGELAKYALASLDWIMKIYGDDQAVGYDIGCSMTSTVKSTSLGPEASSRRLQLVVNAFHGYAHNRGCQLLFHVLYQLGMGIEDLETCERIFSSLNGVARTVRHASYFHWLQFLDLHLRRWDEDRYAELSKFIYNNYRQSLAMISEYTGELAVFKQITGFGEADFERWMAEERNYLENLTEEPEEDLQKVAYVEALINLEATESTYGGITTVEFLTHTPASFRNGYDPAVLRSATVKAKELERRSAHRKLVLAQNVVNDLERRLAIEERWTSESPEFVAVQRRIDRSKFLRAVEVLEGLVVQRLFELAKANISGTGYKLRKHISHAITRRSGAVRTALEHYNSLAPLQTPPRPVLKYSEAAMKYFKVKRAREELVRLNVEASRLQAWVNHEDQELTSRARGVEASQPHLSAHISRLQATRAKVNDAHRRRLSQIYSLKGYSGPVPNDCRGIAGWVDDQDEDSDGVEIEDDDEVNEEILQLGDVVHRLSL